METVVVGSLMTALAIGLGWAAKIGRISMLTKGTTKSGSSSRSESTKVPVPPVSSALDIYQAKTSLVGNQCQKNFGIQSAVKRKRRKCTCATLSH
jgi:hypothetical protein